MGGKSIKVLLNKVLSSEQKRLLAHILTYTLVCRKVIKIMLETLSVQDEHRILKEVLNLDIEKLNHYLGLFKEWIASQKHLPQGFSDNCLKKFLIWSKLDFDKAKKKFERFCYLTTTHSEFFNDRVISMEGDLKILDYMHFVLMPKLTPKGERLCINKIFDPDHYDTLEYCRYFSLAIEYKIHKDSMVTGDIYIYDTIHLQPQHYAKIINLLYFRFLKLSMMNYPFMIRHLFVINCHPMLEKGVAACKAIVSKKIADRVVTLHNPQDLQKYIPPECLPSDYGGTQPSLEELKKPNIEFMLQNEKFFLDIVKVKPTGPIPGEINFSDELGVDGSFRKLNID